MGAYWSKVTLKILVDKKKNRVVFAEADKDFVDILFSFLTMPMGTIVRLTRKQSGSTALGCMKDLYEGLGNLNVVHFKSDKAKSLLLRPSNSSEHLCRKLKINIDDTEPTKYRFRYSSQDMYLIEDNVDQNDDQMGGVFVNGKTRFLISDDLRILQLSTTNSVELLSKFGVRDVNAVEEESVSVGIEEVLALLRLSFHSVTPLTDLFLLKCVGHCGAFKTDPTGFVQRTVHPSFSYKKINLKIMLRRSCGMVLYAEAQEDFVDFLFSLLSIPLGSTVKLLDKTPSLRCIANLYISVQNLSPGRDFKSEYIKTKLLSPKLAQQFCYNIQVLGINESFQPHNRCLFQEVDSIRVTEFDANISSTLPPIGVNAYMDGPATFVVTDDLVVTPLSSISSIFLLKKFQVPITDIEERVVSVGGEEALRLLEASLTSKLALTHAFNLKPKIPKTEK
ncbi:hypothetical protein AQUCO_00900784v1 [Aquilegia coerulea]|uniref:DUF674 family protein n=1 Tax=Aquilegia coerulea TaxID=218851 RepID=A0A2G5EFE2_AQUCA|nr:hypothetical protein AQUCO_00900784v1 [Aquilegia coerulea]